MRAAASTADTQAYKSKLIKFVPHIYVQHFEQFTYSSTYLPKPVYYQKLHIEKDGFMLSCSYLKQLENRRQAKDNPS